MCISDSQYSICEVFITPDTEMISPWKFMKKMKKDRVSAAAAESAFFVIMGFVPFFMLLLTLLQYTELSPEMMMSILMEDVSTRQAEYS